jgi:hypothetical protein
MNEQPGVEVPAPHGAKQPRARLGVELRAARGQRRIGCCDRRSQRQDVLGHWGLACVERCGWRGPARRSAGGRSRVERRSQARAGRRPPRRTAATGGARPARPPASGSSPASITDAGRAACRGAANRRAAEAPPAHPRHVRDERPPAADDERQQPADDDRRRQRPQPAVPEDRRKAVRMPRGEERLQRFLPDVDAQERRGRECPERGEAAAPLAVGLAVAPCTCQPGEPAAGAERGRQHDERRQRLEVAVPVRGGELA